MDAVMVDLPVVMKRPLSASSSTQMEEESRKKEKTEQEIFYAVFESSSMHHDDSEPQYFVHKVDHSSSLQQAAAAGGTDYSMDLGEPIWSLDRSISESKFKSRFSMIVFSSGSIIYFVGGYDVVDHYPVYRPEAYALDLTKLGDGPYEIGSMRSPKPFPLTFGPINGKFYVITDTLSDKCSFEFLNLSTEKWESLPTLESVPALKSYYMPECDLGIDASAVCNSNICLSTMSGLFVFFTESQTWRSFGRFYPPPSPSSLHIPTNLPFFGQAHSLTVGRLNIFLASGQPEAKPRVYKSTHSPVDKDADQPLDECSEDLPPHERFVVLPLADCYKYFVEMYGVKEKWQKVSHGVYADKCEKRSRSDFFQYFGQVEGLESWEGYWAKVPYELHYDYPALQFFYFNDKSRICSVYSGYVASSGDDNSEGCNKNFDIDIWDLRLMDSVKVTATKTVTYKHIGDPYMTPTHFFFTP